MLALLETTFENGWLRRALSTQAMVWLGRISYSLYLWQQLFMGAPSAYLKQWLWAQWPLNILLAIVCGGLGFWVIEQPAQRLRARWSRRRDSMPRTGPVRVGA
jgi:peptidoglycan/LPS O-acetylase OafA/YrhL